ncbi:MAG: ATP-binding protein [Christensenellales bacterium]
MKEIKRDFYLNKLISKKENGLIKIVTGIRRCGKSYLLFNIYGNYLRGLGVNDEHLIMIALDELQNAQYRNPIELDKFIRSKLVDNCVHYVFIDEIQKVEEIQNPYISDVESKITFVDVLLGLMKLPNVDLYVTGSNSKMLSSDILTEFRDRGDEIRVNPLSYKEFCDFYGKSGGTVWSEYITYGGMPLVLTKQSNEDKSKYLKDLFTNTYLKDVIERHNIKTNKDNLEDILNIVSSSIGSLTNPKKLANTFKTEKNQKISEITISRYLDYFIDAFLINKALRFDIKGKKYINTPLKYYFTDIGLRNARLNFRQQEETHIMENVIFNELLMREFNVDVGVVEYNKKEDGNSRRVQLEVDFVASKGSAKYYIQSALHIDEESKREQETNSLRRIDDSFKKIVVVKDDILPYHDEKGILYISVNDFLLKNDAINW